MRSKLLQWFSLFLFLLLPAAVRVLSYQTGRIHGDDVITAYFSANYDLARTNFFAPVPQSKVEWVSQFPAAYFFLQKLFFNLFGQTPISVKLSVTPYVAIVAVMIYQIVKKWFNKTTSYIAVILYSFFPMSLYLETLGLHFISSTAVLLIFFYFCLETLHRKTRFNLILTGFFCALCYLFYTSSYIAFPVLVAFFLYEIINKSDKKMIIKNYLFVLIVFLITLSPFLFYMFKNGNYYLMQRINQVNLISGEWSAEKNNLNRGKRLDMVIAQSTVNSFRSFYTDKIGGGGGYDFGHLAFFSKVTLILFILGCFSCIFLLRKKIVLLFVIIILLIIFFTAEVLTIPPPAYHRFSIAIPFIIIVMSAFFYWLRSVKGMNLYLRIFLIFIILLIYAISSYNYFLKAEKTEIDNEEIRIAKFIHKNYPNRPLYVASFPGYIFQKIFYFIEQGSREVVTDYHDNLLKSLNPDKKYIYIVIFPKSFIDKFQKKDKNGKIIYSSSQYSLFAN